MRIGSDYITLMQHALGGPADARLPLLSVLNDALNFVTNCSEWKFRKRPPLDIAFTSKAAPSAVSITSITRASNIVTVVTATPITGYPYVARLLPVTVAGVTDSTYNATGTTILSVISTTSFTYQANGADGSSSGGTVNVTSPYAFEQFVQLPADFGELLDICTKNNAIANVIMTSIQEIAWRRGSPNSVAYDGLYRVGLSFPGQIDVNHEQAGPQLEIWPRPTSSNGLDLTLTYRAGAVLLTDPSQTPQIPPMLERLLVLTCRLFAQGYEEGAIQEDPLWAKEFAAIVEADGRQQATIGQIQGGAVQRQRQVQVREFKTIADPTSRTG